MGVKMHAILMLRAPESVMSRSFRQPTGHASRMRIVAISTTIAASAWVLLLPSEALACQACACGDATFAVEPSDGEQHVVSAQILAATRPEKYGQDGYPYQFNEWRTDLTLGWAYQRTTVALRLPWLWRELNYEGMELAKTSGFGDMELAASYAFWRNADAMAEVSRWTFAAVHGGLSLPTGMGVRDDRGELLVDDVQPGTGSTTLFAGVNWSVGQGIWSVDGRHTAYFPLPGRFQFQVGPTWQNRVRALVNPVDPLRVGAGFYAAWSAPVKYGDEIEVDTGGFVGYLDLEAEIQAQQSVTLVGGVRVPVVQALRGDHKAQTGVFFGLRFQGEIRGKSYTPDFDAGGYVL